MKFNTIIFGLMLLALTAIRGCRTDFDRANARLSECAEGTIAVGDSAFEDQAALVNRSEDFVSEPPVNLGAGVSGGSHFAKLPLRRIARPSEMPQVVTGWISQVRYGTKSLQRFVNATPMRGPPIG